MDNHCILEKVNLIDALLAPALRDVANDPIQLDQVRVDPKWSNKLPASFAIRRQLLPMCELSGIVQIAAVGSLESNVDRAIQKYLGHPFTIVRCDAQSLSRAIQRVYGTLAASFQAEKQRQAERLQSRDDLPAHSIALCDEMIRAAVLQNASDIHLVPMQDSLRVQFRIDGVLEVYRDLSIELQSGLVNRLKVLANLDIAEKRSPQDGSFSMFVGSNRTKLDVRMATLPTRYGERITLRLLGTQAIDLSLSQLGMRPQDHRMFCEAITRPHGLVLLTGPTGSGKSTTLYAAISEMQKLQSGNIITVEDPIEYEMAGVSQVEVDSSDRISFGKALRSLLRHDPDVVMIGEIRDAETASVAVKASMTGHLVLSTLHTNNAVGVVHRLLDMDVERFLVAATLHLSVAQRLVRRLCPHCRQTRAMTKTEAGILGRIELAGVGVFDPMGCVYCAGRGYSGRMALFEMMRCNETISNLIAGGATESELWTAAHQSNASSLMEDGIAKILSGETSVQEVLTAVTTWSPT